MKRIYRDKEKLEAIYNKYKSAYKVAEELGVNYKTIYYWLKKFNIQAQDTREVARKHFFNEQYFDEIDTEEKAYWLGFIFADGCVYKGTTNYRLQINLQYSDMEHLQRFQKAIGSDYKIRHIRKNNREIAAELKVNSTRMGKSLIKLGCVERKTIVCQFPNIPYELKRHFIRGYFDGDGCITESKNTNQWLFEITGGSGVLEPIADFFLDHNIRLNFYSYKKFNNGLLRIYAHRRTVDYLKEIYRILYDEASIFLPRKKQKFIDLITKRVPHESNLM